jgi:hypothetical protein
MDELKRGFYWRINVLGFGVFQDPVNDSRLNPNNALDVPTYQAAVNPRVDLNLEFRQLELGIKERFLYLWQGWNEGLPKGQEDTRTEFYTNEWFARYRPTDELVASFGRENLQWGPSVFLSSSNPFNQGNGRNNPWVEEPGLGYARAVWIPNSTWSGSFIANYDKGRLGEFGPSLSTGPLKENPGNLEQAQHFKRGYALKLDWTGDGKYFSFIPSQREDTGYRFGFFGGWNVTDALLLYGEGSDGDFGGFESQAGSSYTFQAGQMVNIEYFHNENGCLSKRINQCFARGPSLRKNSAAPLVRGDYLMAQYEETDVWAELNVTFRFIHNLNDQSNQLIGILDHDVGEHTQLYLIANGFTGSRDSEFGSLLNYSLFAGVSYTF